MRYILLLRGVKMMGKNTLVMSKFASNLTQLGLKNVAYYINSGNVFFDSRLKVANLYAKIGKVLQESHHLNIAFVIISADTFKVEMDNLPAFWQDSTLKKSVLFFMPNFDVSAFQILAKNWQLDGEHLYVGQTAIFWAGGFDKSAYNHHLIRPALLKNLSIRNEKTVGVFFDFL